MLYTWIDPRDVDATKISLALSSGEKRGNGETISEAGDDAEGAVDGNARDGLVHAGIDEGNGVHRGVEEAVLAGGRLAHRGDQRGLGEGELLLLREGVVRVRSAD